MEEKFDAQDVETKEVQPETIEDTTSLDETEDADATETDMAGIDESEIDEAADEADPEDEGDEAEDDEADSDDTEDDESDSEAEDDESEENETDDADTEKEDSDSELSGPLERIWKAIRMYRRDEVGNLIREHALDIATDEQKMEIGNGIMGLRDIKLVEQFAKEVKFFTPDMLRLDFENWNNRDFIRQVLSKCKKNFDLSDEDVCKELFEISCEVGQTEVLSFLVSKKKGGECYPMLASGTEEAFAVLKQVKPSTLDADVRVEIMYSAALTSQGQDRLEKLSSFGYDLFEENSDGKTLSDLLNERIVSNSYTKNRVGDMNRIKDKSIVQYIERKKNPVEKPERKKLNIKKALPFLIIGLIFICVLVYAIMYQIFS